MLEPLKPLKFVSLYYFYCFHVFFSSARDRQKAHIGHLCSRCFVFVRRDSTRQWEKLVKGEREKERPSNCRSERNQRPLKMWIIYHRILNIFEIENSKSAFLIIIVTLILARSPGSSAYTPICVFLCVLFQFILLRNELIKSV